MKFKEANLKMYDRIIYDGKLCSVARTVLNGKPSVCVEYIEKSRLSWNGGNNEYNYPGYKSVGTNTYWNVFGDDEFRFPDEHTINQYDTIQLIF